MIDFRYSHQGFVSQEELDERIAIARQYVARAQQDGLGGWVDLPVNYDKTEFARIKVAAENINTNSDYLVCIGIGGSYLGHRAVIEALGGERGRTKVLFAGNSMSARELKKIVAQVKDSDFSVFYIFLKNFYIFP